MSVFVGPLTRIGLVISFPNEICFYEVAFTCELRLPIHPFIMELLGFFGIAPRQLMPNSWRIVVNCMEIWLAANEDMIKVGELVYLYRLKESKEYGYYELVPWARRARIVKGLPSSFRYWESRYLRPPPVRLRVISQGCSVGGESHT